MPLLAGSDEETVSKNVAELIAAGHPHDQAVAIALSKAHPGHRRDGGNELVDWYVCARHRLGLPARSRSIEHRCDASEAHPAAQYVANLLSIHRAQGSAKHRRPHAVQQYPRGLEQEYGSKLVGIVDRARKQYQKLVTELPRLLARANELRGDAVDPDAHAMSAPAWDEREVVFAGLPVVIENDVGSVRYWSDGERVGATVMRYPYGYVAGVTGADGDEVDVYLGPHEDAEWVYVVHQHAPPDFVDYDEDKVMLGFESADAARAAYQAQYTDPRFFGGMSMLSIDAFRAALRQHDGGAVTHHNLDGWPTLDQVRVDASELEFAKHLIDQVEDGMSREITDADIEALARFFAERSNREQRAALAKQLSSALGIEVAPDDRYIPQLVDYFVHENATLIRSIPEELHGDVAKLTARAFSKRMKPDTFQALLEQRFGIAENRARLIARDQIGSLHGQLNQARQAGLGIEAFIWRDAGDTRVRPEHRRRNNKRYVWDDMDPDEIPGVPICCRCVAQPDVTGILAAADARRAHKTPLYRWPGSGVGPH